MDIQKYIEGKGIEVVRDDGIELACLCPYHSNNNTPAFYINKSTGLWICFNPSCAKRGSMRDLMAFFGDSRPFVRDYTADELIESLLQTSAEAQRDEGWDDILEQIRLDFSSTDIGYSKSKAKYFIDRGFDIKTLSYFEIGFSDKKQRIVIPVRNEKFELLGFVGRAIDESVLPKYLNSKGLPKDRCFYNLNNAKAFDSVVVVEGCTDAWRVYEAGYKNVVASLGAKVTDHQVQLLKKYFEKIIIFSDNDLAGYAMRDLLIDKCSDLELMIVEYASPDIHDPGGMTSEQLAEHIENARNFLEWAL